MEKYLSLYPPPLSPDTEEIAHPKKGFSPTLDLHGMTREEAAQAISDFLRNCHRRGIRRALIIHGKGSHSKGPAVLGGMVNELLRNSKEIQDFGPASPKEGGSGATWVVLRQRSR